MKATPKSKKIMRAVQIALAGSMLASGLSHAVLRDHGPQNATNHFPNWYRDNNGLAISQCLSTDESANGPLCLLAGADPNGFNGNFGEEGFYATADIVIPVTGGNFTWMNHLEMAYATGAPPAVWNANDRQEIVFSRERMLFDVPVTPDNSCEGHYIIETPIKRHEFDLVEGKRALFYTDDVAPVPGDFTAALKGHAGPFFKAEFGEDGVTPVSAANPAVRIPSGVPGLPDRLYVGDPNIEVTFVGSSRPTGASHPEKSGHDYVEITPPATCDLGSGTPGAPLFSETAFLSGPIMDQPIADPVSIAKATYTRNTSSAGLDVWADATPAQNIALTASTDGSQHLPSVTMKEELVGGLKQGLYHSHLDFSGTETLPAQVTAVNLTSVPASRASAAVVDAVVVTKVSFDPSTNVLCVAAHSGDEVDPSTLVLAAPYTSTFAATAPNCSGLAPNDVVASLDLDTLSPELRFVPKTVTVLSSRGGSETAQPMVSTGASEANVLSQTVADTFAIDGTGLTPLNLVADNGNGVDTSLPGDYRVVVVSQPEIGTVTAPNSPTPAQLGIATFQAVEGMATGQQSFFYALQNTVSGEVSNVSKVTLNVTQVIPPPVPRPDAQGVFRTSPGATIDVLGNDLTGLSPTAIDPASVELEPLAGYTLSVDKKTLTGLNNGINAGQSRGNIAVQPNGTLLYTPIGQGSVANNVVFSVQYTVANTAGSRSTPATTVQLVLKNAAEAIAFQRVRPTWDIRFTSTYAGPAGAVTLAPVATCKLYTNNTAYANGTGTPIGTVGSASPGAGTNAYNVVGSSPAAPGGNNWVIGCTTTSGGRQARIGQL